MNTLMKTKGVPWSMLNGIFSVYKPPEIHVENIKKTLILNLCRDLNEIEKAPKLKYVCIEGPTNKEMNVRVRDSYASHPLVVGPIYIPEDFKLEAANYLNKESSGILVIGINSGLRLVKRLKQLKLTSFYKIKGIMGQTRENNFKTGRIIEKSTWKHIKRQNIDHICAAMQASHQKKMFELCGVDIQSQAAYELAVKGPIRPMDSKVPMIYSIKCVNFEPPQLTIEIVSINANPDYLKGIISEIGIKLHSSAHCNYLQCTQYGLFNAHDALLSKNWDLANILENMRICKNIVIEGPELDEYHTHLIKQDKPEIEF